jgi:euchromatic histone-lysine N-methyltransferase
MEGRSFHESVPTFVDKSRVLEVKPLRSLAPVFQPPPNTPPFACSPPFTSFPQGLSPLFPFNNFQQTPQNQPNPNTNTNPNYNTQTSTRNEPIFAPSPIQSYRTPNGNSVDGAVAATKQPSSNKRSRKSAVSAGAEFLIKCASFDRDDGNKESVGYVLASFDSLRRRLSQIEDTKEAATGLRRPDLKAGNILMKKNVRTNLSKRIGVVPGVEIGDIFFFRFELLLVGLHAQSMSGIDYIAVTKEEPVAVSIVSSGGYDDDAEDKDVLIYSGQGGSVNKKDKDSGVEDQKLERGNLALEKSLHQANPVRVIRGMKDAVNPLAKVYVYDGLYVIRESWVEKSKTGGGSTFKYKMVRMPGQPSGFGTWKSAQGWKLGFSSPDGLISPDLSSGTEKIPVSLVNNVDDERAPPYFTYLPTLKYTKSFKLSQPSFGCNCQNACKPDDLNCSCIVKNGGDFPYTANGVLVGRKPLLYECGPTCPCFSNCKNRVSQTGLKVHLEVFKTVDRGWGLRSWDPIRAGTFICEYAGEFVENPQVVQSRDRDGCTYIFDTANTYDKSFKWNYDPGFLDEEIHSDSSEDYNIPSRLIISAKAMGNVARFMNHSCSPNVFWQPIIYEHNSESFLHIGFYAINHIPPLTELTFDYGLTSENRMNRKCLCGSPNCRGLFV